MRFRPREYIHTAIYSVLIVLGLGLTHELLHVLFNVIVTGRIADCSTWPLSGIDWTGITTTVTACTSGGLPGWNALFATQVSSLIGLGIALYARQVDNGPVRWSLKLVGIVEWIRYAAYGTGILVMPYMEDGQVVKDMGDGYTIVNSFGQLGMIPGLLIIAIGGVVVWKFLVRDTRDTCSCQVWELP